MERRRTADIQETTIKILSWGTKKQYACCKMAGHNIGDQVCRTGAQMWHAAKYSAANAETYDSNAEKYFKMNWPVHISRVMKANKEYTTEEEILEECENWINCDEKDLIDCEDKEWKACCLERSVQPTQKKTPRVALTKSIPLPPSIILREQKNQDKLLEQNKNEPAKAHKLPQQQNHNDCFIEAHNKILDEQQAANDSINRMQKERTTMVNQLNWMINIDTVHDTKNNHNNIGFEITEDNNNGIISTQQVQVTQETSGTETEEVTHQVPETRRVVQGSPAKNDNNLPPTDTIKISGTNIDDGEIIQTVPETRRIVQKTMLKEKVKSTPADTIESLKESIGVQPNAQNIDTRLLLGSKDTQTAEAFLTIIREYNSLNGSPLNETCTY
jgi:HAMP domain-containing protein